MVARVKESFGERFVCDEKFTPPVTAYLVLDADHWGIGTGCSHRLVEENYYDLSVPHIHELIGNPVFLESH